MARMHEGRFPSPLDLGLILGGLAHSFVARTLLRQANRKTSALDWAWSAICGQLFTHPIIPLRSAAGG